MSKQNKMDIPAIKLLTGHIDSFKKVTLSSETEEGFKKYKQGIEQCMKATNKTVEEYRDYAIRIEEKLKEVKKTLKDQTTQVQNAIQNILGRFVVPVVKDGKFVSNAQKELELVHELEKFALKIANDRLNEMIAETEVALAIVKDEGALTMEELNRLKGCLQSWKKAKKESYEEQQRKSKEENDRKAEKKKDAERRRHEKEDKEREEEERRRREEEAERQKEEEERKRREEEEKLKREEEERQQRKEEEERKKKEAEEKLEREREEKQKREEEDRLKIEMERQRREAEAREHERQRLEEEKRKRRCDPNNWQPYMYDRNVVNEVSGRRPFHDGLCCMLAAPPGDIDRDDVDCTACDELDDTVYTLEDGEKLASSLITIESKKGTMKPEVPARIFLPHCQTQGASEELVVRICVDGGSWVTSDALNPTPNISRKEGGVALSNLAGVEVGEFENVKVMVVSRPRSQTVIVDKPGLSFNSVTDKNVRLYIPRGSFENRTAVRLLVQPIPKEFITANARTNPLWDSIMNTSSMISISYEKAPVKEIEVDISRSISTTTGERFCRGKLYHKFCTRDKVWRFADVEYKGQTGVVSVTLPANRDRFNLFELELPANIPRDSAFKIAETLHENLFKTPARIIVKQREGNPDEAVLLVTTSKLSQTYLDKLKDEGFKAGPEMSDEFGLRDGQRLIVTLTGNIKSDAEHNGKIKFSFFTYMNTVRKDMLLTVKDIYKQKELPAYVGTVKVTVDNGTEYPDEEYDLTVYLPKPATLKPSVVTTRVRFPYYLTSFSGYLSMMLCNSEDVRWEDLMRSIVGDDKKFKALQRQAKHKVDEADPVAMCRVIFLDWMKARPRQEDKVEPVLLTLKDHRLYNLMEGCRHFVDYQRGKLSNKALESIAESTTVSPEELANRLNVDPRKADLHEERNNDKILAILQTWRESDEVIKLADRALEKLNAACEI